MVGNLFGALSPIVVGWCVQNLSSWNIPLVTVAAFYLFAALCWLIIDPTIRVQPSPARVSEPTLGHVAIIQVGAPPKPPV